MAKKDVEPKPKKSKRVDKEDVDPNIKLKKSKVVKENVDEEDQVVKEDVDPKPKKSKKVKENVDEEDKVEKEDVDPKGAKPAAKKLTPTDEYFANLDAVLEANNMLAYIPVVGIDSEDDNEREDNDEDEDDDKRELTTSQLSSLRYILLNAKREALIDAAMKFADPNDGWFNTNSGNIVIDGIPNEVKKAKRKKSFSDQFDSMFALTYALQRLNFWMGDNEMYGEGGDLEKAISVLGTTWKTLLGKSNAELGIDAEFTRPGIESLLSQFAEDVHSSESIEKDFKWK